MADEGESCSGLFTHASPISLTEVKGVRVGRENIFKPWGFWFSKNSEWLDWCDESGYSPHKYRYLYEIEIEFSRILVISSFDDLVKLSEDFKSDSFIDWNSVREKFDGVYFDNFQVIKNKIFMNHILFSKFAWYLSLDCSSGCLFNGNPVRKITLVKEF